MTRATFVCPGCRQSFCVMSPAGDEMVLTCPIPECRRVVWTLAAGLDPMLATDRAPDLDGGDRFVLDCFRLLDCACTYPEEVLSGPADQLTIMARDLNTDPPHDDAALVHRVRDLIQAARPGCTFQPGRRLARAGTAMMAERRR
jgi:hypothetical protein